MFCTVIIPTIGRSTLSRAVESVLKQSINPELAEIIVVNDSGQTLPDALWRFSECVRLVNTYQHERCFARNAGAAVAKGRYLWFLDDDDWIMPGSIEIFRKLAEKANDPAWLYGGVRVIDERGSVLGEVNSSLNGMCIAPVIGGAWVPIQSSMVRQDVFFQVGGFNPHIIGTEDLDLCVRVAVEGRFANTPETVACLLRGSTWDTSTDYLRAPEDVRRSRNRVLSEQGIFGRITSSARSSADSSYWYGRLVRIYLSTVSYNLRSRRLFTALSRMLYCLAVFVAARHRILSEEFWSGVKAHHAPGALHFISEAHEQRIQPEEVATS